MGRLTYAKRRVTAGPRVFVVADGDRDGAGAGDGDGEGLVMITHDDRKDQMEKNTDSEVQCSAVHPFFERKKQSKPPAEFQEKSQPCSLRSLVDDSTSSCPKQPKDESSNFNL